MKRAPSRERSAICLICGRSFLTRHSQGKYCSAPCRAAGHRGHWRAYGQRNREQRRAYHKENYAKRAEAVAARIKAYRATTQGKIVQKAKDVRQREKFPEKYAARQEVLKAKRKGIISPSTCRGCGAAGTQAHHVDYRRPLDVIWLCEACHRNEHRIAGTAELPLSAAE